VDFQICTACGARNRPTVSFCSRCGIRLRDVAPAACPHCAAPLPPHARFCEACGQPVTGRAVAVGVPAPAAATRRWFAAVGALLAAGVLAFGAVVAYYRFIWEEKYKEGRDKLFPVAERRLRDGARWLRLVRGYPLDSEVALRLFEIDALDAPLGSEAALARLAVVGSVPEQLWEPVKATLEQKELLRRYSEMAGAISGAAEQQQGPQHGAATGGASAVPKIELTRVATIRRVRGPMSFSPDGQRLAIVGHLPEGAAPRPHMRGGVIQMWRVPEFKLDTLLVPPPELILSRKAARSIAFSPDGRLLAVGWEGGFVDLWDMAEGQWTRTLDLPLATIRGHPVPLEVTSVAFSPDGRRVVVATWRDVWLWDLESREASTMLNKGGIDKLAFSPNGALFGAIDERWLLVAEWPTGKATRVTGFLGDTRFAPAYALAFSPDGSTLATGSVVP